MGFSPKALKEYTESSFFSARFAGRAQKEAAETGRLIKQRNATQYEEQRRAAAKSSGEKKAEGQVLRLRLITSLLLALLRFSCDAHVSASKKVVEKKSALCARPSNSAASKCISNTQAREVTRNDTLFAMKSSLFRSEKWLLFYVFSALTVLLRNANCQQRPFYNIAHMVNSIKEINYYLARGANAIETDVSFAPNGTALYTFHGYPCDCFRHCTEREEITKYLEYVREITRTGKSNALPLICMPERYIRSFPIKPHRNGRKDLPLRGSVECI